MNYLALQRCHFFQFAHPAALAEAAWQQCGGSLLSPVQCSPCERVGSIGITAQSAGQRRVSSGVAALQGQGGSDSCSVAAEFICTSIAVDEFICLITLNEFINLVFLASYK